MSLAPLLLAPFAVQIHAFGAVLALILAIIQLLMPKGNTRHRVLGYVWAADMMMVAISSFWINGIRWWGPFGPIHILSIVTFDGVPAAVYTARQGNIIRHKIVMLNLVFFALIGAGILASLSSGRIMERVFFGS